MTIDTAIKWPRPRPPIPYAGGKYYATPILLPLMPRNLTAMASIFFGGGSMELSLAAQGVIIHGYDGYRLLTRFWQEVLRDPEAIAKVARRHYPMSAELFRATREKLFDDENLDGPGQLSDAEAAALFYVIQRTSYSALGMSSGPNGRSPDPKGYNPASFDRLAAFRADGLSVKHADFADSIARHPDDFLYLDPPYIVRESRMYGNDGHMHRQFDHQKLANILKGRDNWALSYNDSAEIRDLYAGDGRIFVSVGWVYPMAGGKTNNVNARELLILSPDASKRGISDGSRVFFNDKREVVYEKEA